MKYGVNTFLVSEQIDDSDERERLERLSDKKYQLYSLNYLRKEKLGEKIMKNLLIETQLFEGRVNEDDRW